jgi:predicted ATPase
LRAATNLARLWQGQERRAHARDLLMSIHGQFTEGLETADLMSARVLVAGLQ